MTTTPVNPVLVAKKLSRFYTVKQGRIIKKKVELKALNEVSFSLEKGKTLAIVGESGCGKSTLARVVTMIEPVTSGDLYIGGIHLNTCTREERKHLRSRVQIVFQDPYGSLNPRKKVGSILEEPLTINTSLSGVEKREKVLAVMEKVGLSPEQYNRYPHMFSGGQRQRIAIARALMLNPDIVVADEPVSALDVSVQAQALNLFMDLQDELNLAYLFISHDLSVIRLVCDEVLVMYLGRPVEQGDKKVIFANPCHPYTIALMAATPQVDRTRRKEKILLTGELPSPLDPPPGCPFHLRCRHRTERCQVEMPKMRMFAGRQVACHNVEVVSQIS